MCKTWTATNTGITNWLSWAYGIPDYQWSAGSKWDCIYFYRLNEGCRRLRLLMKWRLVSCSI